MKTYKEAIDILVNTCKKEYDDLYFGGAIDTRVHYIDRARLIADIFGEKREKVVLLVKNKLKDRKII